MKRILRITVILCWVQMGFSQDNSQYRIIASNLGVGGSSKEVVTRKGIYKVSQSIGQSSVIGTYFGNGYYLRQGYQQPLNNPFGVNASNTHILAAVFPNPFNQVLNISFSTKMSEDITVLLYDLNARLIYKHDFLPAQELQIQLNDVAIGTYFLKVFSSGKKFDSKLIKN